MTTNSTSEYIYPKELNEQTQVDICTTMFIEAFPPAKAKVEATQVCVNG